MKKKRVKVAGGNAVPHRSTADDTRVPSSLQALALKRVGGAINFTGLHFQLLCAIDTILSSFSGDDDPIVIRMEGIEDIDVYLNKGTHLIQVKSSQHPIDAGKLWNLKVLHHFLDAYLVEPDLTFELAHNTTLSKGFLDVVSGNKIDDYAIDFWHSKFTADGYTVSRDELRAFLARIRFTAASTDALTRKIESLLLDHYGVNVGTEQAIFSALFNWVFDCSGNRTIISRTDLLELLQFVKDSFSKFPANPAIQHQWITAVDFRVPDVADDSGYYEGKAARPVDIAMGLPVERPQWLQNILQSIAQFDVTVIKSSSGQGKSTLAWLVAHALHNTSYAIYQVQSCTDYNQAIAINDFIVSRVRVGQQPVVVVDGVHRLLAGWHALAKLLRDQPVKMIVTTREEDWVRYGDDAAALLINTISISVQMQEAKLIFHELQVAGKIHGTMTGWQAAWEKTRNRGLLIEFIFLLTRGQMIAERLMQQVRHISSEPDGAVKLEILRMIAVADVLNVKLRTQRLTEHVQAIARFATDRNEVFRQLEKEYYLRFDNKYVEGLHPVRSQHLVEILHSHMDVEETLLHVLHILDDEFVYDFFINAPVAFHLDKGNSFFKHAATLMAQKSFPEMVYAIDGLMHLEPLRFWEANKAVFDAVHQRAGLRLFVMDTVPFTRLQTLKGISDITMGPEGDNIRWTLSQLDQLTPYNIRDSVIYDFVSSLQQALQQRPALPSREGISFLLRWFRQLGIAFPPIVQIDEEQLLFCLANRPIEESSDLFHFYSIVQPEAYKHFIDRHRPLVLGWIKRKTQTLEIVEQGSEMHLYFMLDKDLDKIHEFSIMRARFVFCFFSWYEHYCTHLLFLPYPNEDAYSALVSNANKKVSPSVLGNDFDVHINQIWLKTITSQYQPESAYNWQKAIIDMRHEVVELSKKCTRLLEARLENNQRRVRSLANDIEALSRTFLAHLNVAPDYPSENKKYFETSPFGKEQGTINNWLAAFRNFLNQLVGLVQAESERKIALPVINLESAVFRLPDMQSSFDSIVQKTVSYFAVADLCDQEKTWLTRLYNTALFFKSQAFQLFADTIPAASRAVETWISSDREQRLQQVHAVLSTAESKARFRFIYPTHVIYKEHLRQAVIAVRNCDLGSEQDLWDLSIALMDLGESDLDYCTVIAVDDDHYVIGALRFTSDYFAKMLAAFRGEETDESPFDRPMPEVPDEKMLSSLPGVRLSRETRPTPQLHFVALMFTAWKLGEYRRHLNRAIEPERLWLEEMEHESVAEMERLLPLLDENAPLSLEEIKAIIDGSRNISAEELCQILVKAASVERGVV